MLVALVARQLLGVKREATLVALIIAIPCVALLSTGNLSKFKAFGIEATLEQLRSEKVANISLGAQKLETLKTLRNAASDTRTVSTADGFFGVQKRIVVLDMDTDYVAELQPPPDYQLKVPDQCYSENLDGEAKIRVYRMVQASHNLASTLQSSLRSDNFAGLAVTKEGKLKAFFSPQSFYDVVGIRLWHVHRGILPQKLPCSLVAPLSQSLVSELLNDISGAIQRSDKYESVSDVMTIGELLPRLESNSEVTLALTDSAGNFRRTMNRTDIAVSILAKLVAE